MITYKNQKQLMLQGCEEPFEAQLDYTDPNTIGMVNCTCRWQQLLMFKRQQLVQYSD